MDPGVQNPQGPPGAGRSAHNMIRIDFFAKNFGRNFNLFKRIWYRGRAWYPRTKSPKPVVRLFAELPARWKIKDPSTQDSRGGSSRVRSSIDIVRPFLIQAPFDVTQGKINPNNKS